MEEVAHTTRPRQHKAGPQTGTALLRTLIPRSLQMGNDSHPPVTTTRPLSCESNTKI